MYVGCVCDVCMYDMCVFVYVQGIMQSFTAVSTTQGVPTMYAPLTFILAISAFRSAVEVCVCVCVCVCVFVCVWDVCMCVYDVCIYVYICMYVCVCVLCVCV